MTRQELPVFDLVAWRSADATRRREAAAGLNWAFCNFGFILLSDGGSLSQAQAEIRVAARKFFALSSETKERYATAVGGRGWIPPLREANAYYGESPDATLADLKETYVSGSEHRTGDSAIDEEWFLPNIWPVEVSELDELCSSYAAAVRLLYLEFLEVCAIALDLPPETFSAKAQSSPYTFNINRYPPRTEFDPKLGQFRIAPHTDWGIITFLDRQPGYGGLQIERSSGEWEDPPYVPGTFTVNVGDLMERWTGGRWRSTRHRVLPPPAEAPDEELISLIIFLEADMDALISPLVEQAMNSSIDPVVAGDYLRERHRAAMV